MAEVIVNNQLLLKVLDAIKTKVSDLHYNNWFKNTSWSLENEKRVLICVDSKFVRDWISENYLDVIKFELFKISGVEHEVLFKIQPNTATTHQPKFTTGNPAPSLPVKKKEENPVLRVATGLNPRYSFDNFVVGNSNQFAHAGSLAVASNPAKNYNPFFIYGGVGLGKTHLLNAIGLEILKNKPNAKILLVTGEQFTNEVVNAIRYQKTFELRQKYRVDCDALLIDDIQFIAGKERTMEEFFHTFNALYESRKQIVLTSDLLPKDIPNLEERLRSRFSWGLLADIQIPELETRMAILEKKAEEDKIPLSKEVSHLIASNIKTNIRDLEGCLVRASALASLKNSTITTELASDVLKKVVGNFGPTLTIEAIQQMVANHFQLKISDLKSARRHKNLSHPRQIAMYLCKKHIKSSYPEIGQKFGGKDHTTVIHAFQKIEGTLSLDPSLKDNVDHLEKLIVQNI